MTWIHLVQNAVKWQPLVKEFKNFRCALTELSKSIWPHVIPSVLTDSTGLHTCNIHNKTGNGARARTTASKMDDFESAVRAYIAFVGDNEDTKWHMPVSWGTNWLNNL